VVDEVPLEHAWLSGSGVASGTACGRVWAAQVAVDACLAGRR